MSVTEYLKAAYLTGAPALRPFYRYAPHQPDWEAILQERRHHPVDRERLVRALSRQYEGIELTSAMRQNLDDLASPATVCITTGHQPVLLGGPLFTFYKTLTAIQYARQLDERWPGTRVVPVFWLATEDHDIQEVNHYYPGYFHPQVYRCDMNGPAGRHRIEHCIGYLEDLPAWLHELYPEGRSWGQAFRQLWTRLFGEYGLLVLDGDDAELKEIFLPVMQRQVREQAAYHQLLQSSEALTRAGFHEQAQPQALNLFFMDDAQRTRIDPHPEGGYAAGRDRHWPDAEALLAEMEATPEAFSPNALLRPLYQEQLLPNLAYIGGWGELSYWLQLKSTFEAHALPYPLLLPRASATLVAKRHADALLEEHQALAKLLEPLRLMREELLNELWPSSELDGHRRRFEEAFLALAGHLADVDPGQQTNVLAQRQRFNRVLAHIDRQAAKARLNQEPARWQALREAHNHVQADGFVQERTLNFLAFAREEAEVRRLIAHLETHLLPDEMARQMLVLPGA